MAEITCKVITFPVLSLFIETDAYIFPSSVTVLFPSWDGLVTQALKNMTTYFMVVQIKLLFPLNLYRRLCGYLHAPAELPRGNSSLFSMNRMNRKWVDTGHVWTLWRRENLLHLRTDGRM